MDDGYRRSIFAHELAAVLAAHGYTIEGLRRAPFTFDKEKVARLQSSQRTIGQLPALSHHELMSIVLLLKLSEEERLRLYAALIALGAQRLLLDYLSGQRAWEIACEVRDAALAWLREHKSNDDLMRRRWTRGPVGTEDNVRQTGAAGILAQALDIYDEGTATAALGMLAPEGAWGRAQLARALVLLERAKAILVEADMAEANGENGQYWSQEIDQALQRVREELR